MLVTDLSVTVYLTGCYKMYKRDVEIIDKLRLNALGKYNRFTQGDIEYIIDSLVKLCKIENQTKQGRQ